MSRLSAILKSVLSRIIQTIRIVRTKLDWGSIRSSPRDALTIKYSLQIHVYMGDLHLVLLALNLSILDAGILIMVQQVSLMMSYLTMVDYPVSFLLLSTWIFFGGQVEGTILRCSYSLSFVVGPLLHA